MRPRLLEVEQKPSVFGQSPAGQAFEDEGPEAHREAPTCIEVLSAQARRDLLQLVLDSAEHVADEIQLVVLKQPLVVNRFRGLLVLSAGDRGWHRG